MIDFDRLWLDAVTAVAGFVFGFALVWAHMAYTAMAAL